MTENSKKPRIRFKGFTEDWEQRKLNEMVDYISSNLTSSDASKDGNYELYDANNIIGRTNHEPIKTGYLTIIKDGAGVGRIRKMPKNTMFIGTMGALKPINNSIDFVFSLLTRFSLSNEFSGSTIPHIYFKDYGNNIYFVPKLKEQNKIGDLYCKLDNLITLHQRKYDKLLNVKKALLEKMFPKNGKNTPEIRFKGFTEAWEQRKFIDLLDFERPDNYMVSDDHYENDGVPVLTANKAFVLGYKNESGAYNKGNCVIFDDFTLDSKFVDFPFKINSSAIKILTAKHNNNLKFIYYLLSSSNILMQGHARHYISIVQPFVTSVPKTQEQNKIECMISDLDNLITLHQRECEKLKNVKKSLLEKMFV